MDAAEVVKNIKPSIALVYVLDTDSKLAGTGSGFVYGEKGILVTCNHVVKDASSVVIKFPDSEFLVSKVLLHDDEHDLALLKFEDATRVPLEKARLEDIVEGMEVLFSGYPLSLRDLTTHQGILSAITKDAIGLTTYLIDGTVNSGNSGCPLMDKTGKLIGVVNAKRREHSDLLAKVEKMQFGAISLYGLDMVAIYQALINNVQLGIGYAVPASYIPDHKTLVEKSEITEEPLSTGNK